MKKAVYLFSIAVILVAVSIPIFAQTKKSRSKIQSPSNKIDMGMRKVEINKFGILSISLPAVCGEAVEHSEKSGDGDSEKTTHSLTWTCKQVDRDVVLFSFELAADEWHKGFANAVGVKTRVVTPKDLILRDYAETKMAAGIKSTLGDFEEVSYLVVGGKNGVYHRTHNKDTGFRVNVWQTHRYVKSKATTIYATSATKLNGLDALSIIKSIRFGN